MKVDTKSKSFKTFLGLIIGAVIFILIPLPLGIYEQNILILIMYYAFAAMAWNILCGFVGTLSLGHGVFVGVGGYISSLLLLNLGLSPWIGMFVGATIAALFGVLIGYPCFRLKGPYFALTTIAFNALLCVWVTNNESLFGIDIKGSMGLSLPNKGNDFGAFQFSNKLVYYYVIFGFVIIGLIITYLLKRSKLGYYLTAIKSDPDAAESLGIHIGRYKMIAMLISSFMIAFAGTFYAQYFRYISPDRIFGGDFSIEIALIGLVGGQGTVFGPLLGALLLVPIGQLLSGYFGGSLPGLHLFIYGLIMILVIFFMPMGINSVVVEGYHKLKAMLNKKEISNGAKYEKIGIKKS